MKPLVLVFLIVASPAAAQTLTDTEVQAAIRAGETNRFQDIAAGCHARAGFGEGLGAALVGGVQRDGGFTVAVSTGAGRIAALAAASKRQYKAFTLAQVDDALRVPQLFVVVEPDNPSRSGSTMSVAAPVQHVVLRSRDKSGVVIQPTNVATETLTWANLLGGSVEANRATAHFDPPSLRELPPGDVEVIVITSHGERKCRISGKDRAKAFPK